MNHMLNLPKKYLYLSKKKFSLFLHTTKTKNHLPLRPDRTDDLKVNVFPLHCRPISNRMHM